MDPSVPDVEKYVFNLNAYWKEFYEYVLEEEPHCMAKPLGKTVYVGCFVDAHHGGNVITRPSHSGIFLFVNNALIKSFSKRLKKVELSTFVSELLALSIAWDMIVEIRIKLKMFGFPLAWPDNVFCDKNWVVKNKEITESNLS